MEDWVCNKKFGQGRELVSVAIDELAFNMLQIDWTLRVVPKISFCTLLFS